MFKYLKQLFHDAMIQSRQFVAVAENPESEIARPEEEQIRRLEDNGELLIGRMINSSPIDDRFRGSSGINHMDCVDPRDPPLQLGAKETTLENSPSGNSRRPEGIGKIGCDTDRIGETIGSKKICFSEGATGNEEKNCRSGDDFCECENCLIVTEIGECGVCLEPLQSRGVRSCPLCANVVCALCAARLKKCAFCRIALPMQKNRAIERLLGKLSLPCRNARSGCQKLLKSETRLKHEASCDYASVACPRLNDTCKWQGRPGEILGHLKEAHEITPHTCRELFVEVSNSWPHKCGECKTNIGECTAYLTCYSQLFAVSVTRHRKKWNLEFFQLAYVGSVTEKTANSKFGVRVKVKAVGCRSFREVLPFDKFNRGTPTIEIGSRVAGTVNIEISIREINDEKKI